MTADKKNGPKGKKAAKRGKSGKGKRGYEPPSLLRIDLPKIALAQGPQDPIYGPQSSEGAVAPATGTLLSTGTSG